MRCRRATTRPNGLHHPVIARPRSEISLHQTSSLGKSSELSIPHIGQLETWNPPWERLYAKQAVREKGDTTRTGVDGVRR